MSRKGIEVGGISHHHDGTPNGPLSGRPDASVGLRPTHTQLRKRMTMVDVIALGVGSSVGVAIFSILAPAAKLAGAGILAAIAIAAIPMVIFAVVYAFMGSTVPRSGASYDWPARFVHPLAGFMVAWLRILGNTAALIVLTQVLIQYLSKAVTLPERPAMLGLLAFFCVANLLGVHVAARIERILVLVKVVALAAFTLVGIWSIHLSNFHPALGNGASGMFAAIAILVSLYMGIESAVEVGEEIKNGTTIIAEGLGIAALITTLIYLGVSAVAVGVLGTVALSESATPLLDAGTQFLGRWNTPIILFAAVAAIGTSINGIYLTFTRFLFAMGQDRVLPAALADIHPRWATPHVAILAVFCLSVAGLLLPSSLLFLFLAINIPTMLKYFFNCLAAERLATRHPELHERARFHLKVRTVKAWAYAGMVSAVIMLAAGLTADWRPYAILIVWAAVGALYWKLRGPSGRRTNSRHDHAIVEAAVSLR